MNGFAAVAEAPHFTVQKAPHSTVSSTSQQRAASGSSVPQGQTMPLSFLKCGESASVLKVRGGGELHHHLENLGFVEGAVVRVVSEQAGNYIVEVKGAQVALDRSVASKIITAAA